MTIRRDDPRSKAQKEKDEKLRLALEYGTLPQGTRADRKKAIEAARKKKADRKSPKE